METITHAKFLVCPVQKFPNQHEDNRKTRVVKNTVLFYTVFIYQGILCGVSPPAFFQGPPMLYRVVHLEKGGW
jgi:hypothetical protein